MSLEDGSVIATRSLDVHPATALYEGDSFVPPTDDRVRVALVGGSGRSATDELYRLLRRRLFILTTITALAFFVGFVVDLLRRNAVSHPVETEPNLRNWFTFYWWPLLNLFVALSGAIVLGHRPPCTVRGLRRVELVTVGSLIALLLALGVNDGPYGYLERAAAEPFEVRQAFLDRYINAGSLLWFMCMTTYAAMIPNTLRRCVAVLGAMAVSPLVLFVLFAFWIRPLDRDVAVQVIFMMALYNAIAVAVGLFSASRIEYYRQQATAARKLGQYVLRDKLGAGGMGEVYRAEHLLLRRPCAIKLIRPERAGDPHHLRRFEREVRLTATLTHPNTVQIFDYGHAEDGTFYYAMEYLPGLTLEELVKRHGVVPPARAINFLRQVCGALRDAHARGLIHRDVKPGNVMICERGGIHDVAKLLDFGLVRPPREDDDEKLTRDGTVAGTPAYLSPEQAGGRDAVDERSDIYSIGALAYFLLTGRPPFAGRSMVQTLAAHLYETPSPPSAIGRVPADLETIVMRCLAKSPAERYPNAARLDASLADCRDAAGWTERDADEWWAKATKRDGAISNS